MDIKKSLSLVIASILIITMALTGCGGGRGSVTPESVPSPEATPDTVESGFASDATIGVSLPWLGTQNWKEADVMFKEQLEAAGFKALVQAADNKVPQQQQQIESMIQNGAKVIVVGPVDGSQLGAVLEEAKAAGIYVIGYDRLLENTTGVDAVVQYGATQVGVLQAQSLLEGLKAKKGDGPWNIELFAGSPSDPNAPLFFEGSMTVLQPLIDDGTLNVVSGQVDFTQAAVLDWDASRAQARMDSLLAGFYSDKEIHGVLSPNDGFARAVITASEQAGQTIPIVTGQDAEDESVRWIWEGKQWSSIVKPTHLLVEQTIELIKLLQAGKEWPAFTNVVDNGKTDVGLFELAAPIATKENAKEVFASDAARLALLAD